MDLGYVDVEDLREAVLDGESTSAGLLSFDRVSVGSVVELACLNQVLQFTPARAAVTNLSAQLLPLAACLDAIQSGANDPPADGFEPRKWEFFPIQRPNSTANSFYLFQERFRAALQLGGFGQRIAHALCGALVEMSDNVIQHAAIAGQSFPAAVVGYHVIQDRFSFAVGDAGRGILASLHENPEWSHLADSVDALDAITKQCASRRVGLGPGEGFKQLLKSLADLNGWLRFRSGDAYLHISGNSACRTAERGTITNSTGFQLTVTCARCRVAEGKEEIFIDNLT